MAFNGPDRTQAYSTDRLGSECADKFIRGPMKVDPFLSNYVPSPPSSAGEIPEVTWDSVLAAQTEDEMYAHFLAACKQLDPEGRVVYCDTCTGFTITPLGEDSSRKGFKSDTMTSDPKLPFNFDNKRISEFACADRLDDLKQDNSYDPFDDSVEHDLCSPLSIYNIRHTQTRQGRHAHDEMRHSGLQRHLSLRLTAVFLLPVWED